MFTTKRKGIQKISIDSVYEVVLSASDDSGMVDKRQFKKDRALLKKFMKKFNKKPDFFRFDFLDEATRRTIGMAFLENKEFFSLFSERYPRWRCGNVLFNVSKKDIDSIARSLKEIKFVYKDRTDRVNLYLLSTLVGRNPTAVQYALTKHKITEEPLECGRCHTNIDLPDNKGRCYECGTPLLLRNNKRIKATHTFAEKVAA